VAELKATQDEALSVQGQPSQYVKRAVEQHPLHESAEQRCPKESPQIEPLQQRLALAAE
jgi:hypothetical protein